MRFSDGTARPVYYRLTSYEDTVEGKAPSMQHTEGSLLLDGDTAFLVIEEHGATLELEDGRATRIAVAAVGHLIGGQQEVPFTAGPLTTGKPARDE